MARWPEGDVWDRVGIGAAVTLGGLLAGAWFASGRLVCRRNPDPPVDPSAYGLEAEEVRFPSRDGLLLGGYWIPARRRKGTVVLLPGQGGSLDPDLIYAPALVHRGYDVLLFDFRGHGRSQGDYVSWGYYEYLDLLGALDFLQQRGIHQVGVWGFSMGAAVAIRSAADAEAIAAIVSDGSYADLQGALYGWAAARGLQGRAIEWFARLILKMAGWRLGCQLENASPVRWVGHVSPRPILFIQGERDPFVPMRDFLRLWHAAQEPKERWIVPGAGHREADKLYPAAYRQRVLDFFDRHLAGRRGRRR
ncbi:MAG: alpha/beta fold hydrolase [Chloroflexi bacterium]|nr:alpha/beta fold hydrolase [Chloroflexota bacterium]